MRGSILVLMIFSLIIITACDRRHTQLEIQQQVKAIKTQISASNTSLPYFKMVPQAIYNATHLKDPFQPLPISNHSVIALNQEPLETFSLDTLQLVGTIKKAEKFWALIRAPDENIYPITIGQYLGINHAQVVSITEEAVKINEKIQLAGEWKQQTMQLLLK